MYAIRSYYELKAACKVLNRYSPIAGKRVLIITDGGGIGISIADSCEEAGLKVPELSETAAKRLKEKLPPFASVRNPIDLTGSVRDEHYVITSYSIHYTKLYDRNCLYFRNCLFFCNCLIS